MYIDTILVFHPTKCQTRQYSMQGNLHIGTRSLHKDVLLLKPPYVHKKEHTCTTEKSLIFLFQSLKKPVPPENHQDLGLDRTDNTPHELGLFGITFSFQFSISSFRKARTICGVNSSQNMFSQELTKNRPFTEGTPTECNTQQSVS